MRVRLNKVEGEQKVSLAGRVMLFDQSQQEGTSGCSAGANVAGGKILSWMESVVVDACAKERCGCCFSCSAKLPTDARITPVRTSPPRFHACQSILTWYHTTTTRFDEQTYSTLSSTMEKRSHCAVLCPNLMRSLMLDHTWLEDVDIATWARLSF